MRDDDDPSEEGCGPLRCTRFSTTLELTQEEWDLLEMEAYVQNRTVQQIVDQALAKYFRSQGAAGGRHRPDPSLR